MAYGWPPSVTQRCATRIERLPLRRSTAPRRDEAVPVPAEDLGAGMACGTYLCGALQLNEPGRPHRIGRRAGLRPIAGPSLTLGSWGLNSRVRASLGRRV